MIKINNTQQIINSHKIIIKEKQLINLHIKNKTFNNTHRKIAIKIMSDKIIKLLLC